MVLLFNKIFCGLLEYIIKSNVAVTQNKGLLFSLQRDKAVKYFSGKQKREPEAEGLTAPCFHFVWIIGSDGFEELRSLCVKLSLSPTKFVLKPTKLTCRH